ncbi:MAG: DUF4058 family protein [Chloroflexota bacterium]
MPLTYKVEKDDELPATVIYRVEEGKFPGTPVTRIELLSPANKTGGSHHATYRQKRRESLKSGLRFVEIDYLHERAPVIAEIGSYAAQEPDSYPYHVIVTDPRAFLEQNQVQVYGVRVLDPLPHFAIPLDEQDVIAFDLNAVYHHTYSTLAGFHGFIDYAELPANFTAYTRADQQAIRVHMAKIAAERGDGS